MTFDTRTMAVNSSTGLIGDEPMTVEFESVKTPLPSDILCGKNKICIKHPGSRSFRAIIESYTLKYQQASSRNEKMEVTKEIFDKLQTRRFLKYNEENDMWETLHPLAVRDKIGHALRFSNRKGSTSIRKQVRRSTSDMASLQQADMASMRPSMSMGCIDSFNVSCNKPRQNVLRNSTGNMPFSGLMLNQSNDMQTSMQPLSTFSSLGLGNHMLNNNNTGMNSNLNAVFPLRTPSTQAPPSKDNDLSWMMQMPLLDMDAEGQVYMVNGQQQVQQQQMQLQQPLHFGV